MIPFLAQLSPTVLLKILQMYSRGFMWRVKSCMFAIYVAISRSFMVMSPCGVYSVIRHMHMVVLEVWHQMYHSF